MYNRHSRTSHDFKWKDAQVQGKGITNKDISSYLWPTSLFDICERYRAFDMHVRPALRDLIASPEAGQKPKELSVRVKAWSPTSRLQLLLGADLRADRAA